MNVDTIKNCALITVSNETRDQIVFEITTQVVIQNRPQPLRLEISCPTVQGRLRLKNARVQTLSKDNTQVPKLWSSERLEETLERFIAVDTQSKLVTQQAAPAVRRAAPNLNTTTDLLAQAAASYKKALDPKDATQAMLGLPAFMRMCSEAFLKHHL